MLTGSKLKRGEGKLEEIDIDIGSRRSAHRKAMDPHGEEGNLETEDEFKNAFMDLKRMVEELYRDRMEKKTVGSSRKYDKEKRKGIGGDDKPPRGDGDGPLESPSSHLLPQEIIQILLQNPLRNHHFL